MSVPEQLYMLEMQPAALHAPSCTAAGPGVEEISSIGVPTSFTVQVRCVRVS